MGEKCSSMAFAGTGTGKFPPRGDGDGGSIPDEEFPIAILTGSREGNQTKRPRFFSSLWIEGGAYCIQSEKRSIGHISKYVPTTDQEPPTS